ncbi:MULTISPECIES: LacI family DNA-binding transcriptional regulator [unclassified Serratia (in: enterobacteria)]|uniref:LacI family DNA-binding transcriptional regulator n=1 Tax=unclassified Serratia (in: enterobacteria) TaxID=2647522 RepID=UPI000503D90B|nr:MULTISPECIES: LacI family DNA-binding transcriptional regulator [unclassified Serratia (in: enterobacteria)]KFK93070.1 LacI family transcriptional regulator [Serratia sp. Ag2]KFK99242.1 LacI family transcriptional regulator [Serratia sp. Ag1]
MVTLEDVAALAGVSRATVSRVVNGDSNVKLLTREKVAKAVAELGYTPNPAARALASSHSNTLGLVTTSYRGGFFGALMDFVQTEAESHGKQLLVTQGRNSAENELLAIQRLFSLRCDGVILHVRFLSDDQLRQLATEQQRPFVLLDRLVPGLEERCVTFDHVRASQMATQALIDAGHQRIACISGPMQRASSQLRLQGFLNAMQAADLQPVDCLAGVYDLQSGYDCADQLLRRATLPSAIYCCNEEMAIGALLAINEHHLRVPQDIALICYDSGERAPFVRPALTSVHFPITEMAQYATRRLINPLTPAVAFEPIVVRRDSIATIAI